MITSDLELGATHPPDLTIDWVDLSDQMNKNCVIDPLE